MKYQHHNLVFELPDLWLSMSKINKFTPESISYKPDKEKAHGREIILINITDIAPSNERARNKGVFCDNDEATAKQRVIRIFKWFISRAEIEPVRVSLYEINSQYKYKLIDGCHRFHCSIVAGFSTVPATLETDFNGI